MIGRILLVLTVTFALALSGFAGSGKDNKTTVKNKTKECSMEKSKVSNIKDEHCKDAKLANAAQCDMMKSAKNTEVCDKEKVAANMDCCKKDMKEAKASKTKDSKQSIVKLIKDTK